jgi:hypothetical protein
MLSHPKVTFLIQGVGYTLTPEDYVISKDKAGKTHFYRHTNPNECRLGFGSIPESEENSYHSSATGKHTWILGNIFISKFLLILDFEKRQIGIGLKNILKQQVGPLQRNPRKFPD